MAIVTGDRYLERLSKFLEDQAEPLIEGTKVLKLNPAGLHYVHSRLEALQELERLLSGAPVDYLRAYVSDLGDYRALEQLRRIIRLLPSLKVVSILPPPARDPTPLSLLLFSRLKVLELRGCDLSTSAAKGLLELRHTIEKILCHNSTDALRHVFASRIAEIKDSPKWNKLSFVSCACNRLVLMDESLQLLPAVEILDLSRNKFAKVDNLRCCTKLRHLDLGFNHLRTVSHFSEVSCHIVKLVLRNNALTTLGGIENLKSLEGLDLSYNLISNISELEILGGLSSLEGLWLEGNPLCCARWYRAQVFSYFAHPHKLKLDDKEISTKEFWKRQIIIARRQKIPSSFGFYSPANDDAEGEGWARKKKKVPRLASIDSEEDSTYICSDQDSTSSQHENQSKDKDTKSDGEAEIYDLINTVENLKKERSVLWLREFKQWMDPSAENLVDASNSSWVVNAQNKKSVECKKNQKHHGESSRKFLAVVPTSGDEKNTSDIDSYDSHVLKLVGCNGTLSTSEKIPLPGIGQINSSEDHEKFFREDTSSAMICLETLRSYSLIDNRQIATDDMMMSYSSSVNLGSPPHYQKDVLHRRQNLVEEILQLSADSNSVALSDSMTSSSDDDFYESEESIPEVDHLVDQEVIDRNEVSSFLRSTDQLQEPIFARSAPPAREDIIQNYFLKKVANSGKRETCKLYLSCNCLLKEEYTIKEREVVLLLSSEHKLYVLLVGNGNNEPGSSLTLFSWHRVEDVQDASVGLGLQVVRICIEGGTTYLFITKSIEKSEELLTILQVLDSQGKRVQCPIRSLEQVQVELFEKEICGGLKLGIFQYSIVQFCTSMVGEQSWPRRSLFVTRRYLLLCLEDLTQFGSLADDCSSPYLSLDSCCSVADVSEMAIEARRGLSLTLSIKRVRSEFHSSTDGNCAAGDSRLTSACSVRWKLKWFSEEGLFKFVALLKALHRQTTGCSLPVKSFAAS